VRKETAGRPIQSSESPMTRQIAIDSGRIKTGLSQSLLSNAFTPKEWVP
jgi:hypothetical protein